MIRKLVLSGIIILQMQSAFGASLSVHENITGFTAVPAFQAPIQCEKAQEEMSEQLGQIRNWFRPVMYGTSEERIILSNIAVQIHDKLLALGRHAIMAGRQKYRNHRIQTLEQNGDNLCYKYITDWRLEINRVFSIIIAEAEKGNRALEGIGIEELLN